METYTVETRGMKARGMDARGLEMQSSGCSSRNPMPGEIQRRGLIYIGADCPQGPRQVSGSSGVGNLGGGLQEVGMQGGECRA